MTGIATYQENSVVTQSGEHLIVMLYDGAIKFLYQAIRACEADDAPEKGNFVAKTVDIINELDSVLDVEAGGDVALNLRKLYDFMRRHILKAHVKNDPRMFRDVIDLLEELNESWRTISL